MNDIFSKELYIAHRGFHNISNKIPENSMYAFQLAISNNIAIELDIHLLKDGNIVVFHDDNLLRMTGINRPLKKCTYDEIKNLKLLNTNQTIPLFKDVLNLVSGKVLLDIEFKTDNKTGLLEKLACNLLDNYTGKFIVKSFNPFSVLWFKNNRKNYVRGILSRKFYDFKIGKINKIVIEKMLFNFLIKPNFIAYDINSMPNKKIENYIKNGGTVIMWGNSSIADIEKCRKYGCNHYIFENIEKTQ